MLASVLVELEKEQREMERNVFEYPPKEWAEFTRKQGEWTGLKSAIDRVTAVIEGAEADERHK